MSAVTSVTQNAAVHRHHAAPHTPAPKVAQPDADDVAKTAPAKVASLSPGQLLNKVA